MVGMTAAAASAPRSPSPPVPRRGGLRPGAKCVQLNSSPLCIIPNIPSGLRHHGRPDRWANDTP
eukprot:3980748-Alexandrium_andersonii.AAC.1